MNGESSKVFNSCPVMCKITRRWVGCSREHLAAIAAEMPYHRTMSSPSRFPCCVLSYFSLVFVVEQTWQIQVTRVSWVGQSTSAWLDPLSLWAFSSISNIVLETGMASEIRIKLLPVTHASWLGLSYWNINVRWWSLDLPFERGNLGRHGSIEFNYGALVE